jgi:hypothetical protein
MIHSLKYSGFSFLLMVLLLSTCKKKEIYPSVPSIEYKDATFYMASDGTDSLMVLTFSFKDGDGDIGLNQQDTNPPFQAARDKYNFPTNPYYHNLHIDYYELIDNKYQQIIKDLDPDATPPVFDTLRYQYRIENITPDGRHKAIRGDIEVKIFPSPHFDAKDTVKYEFFIYDRALNKSNRASSPPIVWKRQP